MIAGALLNLIQHNSTTCVSIFETCLICIGTCWYNRFVFLEITIICEIAYHLKKSAKSVGTCANMNDIV